MKAKDTGKSTKAKNPGSPQAAAERQVRTLYSKAVSTGSRNATSAKRVADAKRAKTYGPTGGAQPRPTRGGGSMVADKKKAAIAASKAEGQSVKDAKALKAKLRGVDYNALGRYMQAKGYGAAGRKAANKGKPTLPKTK